MIATYQIQVALREIKPKIWRRLLIPSNLLLPDLHRVIQTSMGWDNMHLHQFTKNNTNYSVPAQEDWGEEIVDYRKIKVSDLLQKVKDKMIYEYDFGDGWEHEVILEKIIPSQNKIIYPHCIDGKMNCPPEDCGGIGGFENLLEILKNPKHKEYKGYIEWLGDDYNPTYFDVDLTNKDLKLMNYGCFEF